MVITPSDRIQLRQPGLAVRLRRSVAAPPYDAVVLTSTPVGDGARPPWWRTGASVLVTGFLGLSSLAMSPMSWGFQQTDSGALALVLMLVLLIVVGSPVSLFWRHRIPFSIAVASALLSVVLPTGNALPLLSLAVLIGRRRGPAVWWTAGLIAITSTWVTVADAMAQPVGASFWKTVLGPQPANRAADLDLPVSWIALIIALQLALTIGTGLLVRSRREAQSAREVVRVKEETAERLGDEVARRQERERIAREVHDVMGYRLSLLNLHAGALEANSPDDPRVAESAQLIRQSANATMDDLRSLLDVLREPVGAEPPTVSLADLAAMVQESFGAAQPLNSSIFIEDSERADPALARAVYRIVQELLTNSRKHAPGEQVFLSVTGNPASGVVIDVRNRYTGSVIGPAGTSRGLAGITERVQLLGGTVGYGLDGDSFRVRVELPWRGR